MRQGRPEAKLEVDVLLELGQVDGLSLFKNESGKGYYRVILPLLEKLAEQGPGALFAGWRSVLYRNVLTYGLGVGSPDHVGHLRGQFLGIELKSERGTLSPDQREWHAVETAKGARIVTVKTVDQAVDFVKGIR